jgi:hypothetical protein
MTKGEIPFFKIENNERQISSKSHNEIADLKE